MGTLHFDVLYLKTVQAFGGSCQMQNDQRDARDLAGPYIDLYSHQTDWLGVH